MSNPLVSIGLTCYNAEETIERAILSALGQNWPNIELIIVDDRSSDNSVSIIKAVIAGDKRAKMIQHDRNLGPAGSRNTVLDKSNGEFIAFFDDDDESFSDRISTQIKSLTDYELKSGANLVSCYAGGERQYENGYIKPLPGIGSSGKEAPNGRLVADYLLFYHKQPEWFYGAGVPTCALLARRFVFTYVGGFDETLRRVEDVDFAIRLALAGGHFIGTLKPLFRQYATDAIDKSPKKNLDAEQILVRKNEIYLKSIRRYYHALHWPKLRYWHFKKKYVYFLMALLMLFSRNPIVVIKHLMMTGPQRLRHERLMRRKEQV